MKRRHPVGVLVVCISVTWVTWATWVGAVATIAIGSSGCSENPVGRLCDLGAQANTTGDTVLASPSLDCVSRTCLHYKADRAPPPGASPQANNSGLCTADCSADSDCDRVPESPCITGFTCAIAVTAGEFCCRKVCICKDYIMLPESGQPPDRAACDPNNEKNACCNLPGRVNNPKYEMCKG